MDDQPAMVRMVAERKGHVAVATLQQIHYKSGHHFGPGTATASYQVRQGHVPKDIQFRPQDSSETVWTFGACEESKIS